MKNYITKAILALVAADIISDIKTISGIVNKEQTQPAGGMTYAERHPLIGRRMKVQDNSWIIDKETGCETDLYGREVVVVSDPYKEIIYTRWDDSPIERLFVDVASLDTGRRYRVLFRESWLID